MLTCCRNEQSHCFHRLRPRSPHHQPSRAVVSAAGKASSIHNSVKVHRSLRAADEPESQLSQQVTCTRHTAAATRRGCEQTAGPTSSGTSQYCCSKCLLDGQPTVSITQSRWTRLFYQQHVHARRWPHWEPSGLWRATKSIRPKSHESSAGANASGELWSSCPAAAATTAATAGADVSASWETAESNDHGAAAEWHPCSNTTRRQPPRSQRTYPIATQPCLLPTTCGWGLCRSSCRASQWAERQPATRESRTTKQPRFHPDS